MNDFPAHLLLPLLASLLFVCGLLFIKRASAKGTGPWTVTFVANMWAACLFTLLWLLGGTIPSWSSLWQPALIAGLYILGQVFTFAAVEHGDVSVATPVFGVKVIVVAFLLSVFAGFPLTLPIWIAVGLAAIGIMLVQWNPGGSSAPRKEAGVDEKQAMSGEQSRLVLSIVLAICAASSFGTFDVVVQKFSPLWGGPGRILPIAFWMAGFLSLGFLPFCQRDAFRWDRAVWALFAGGLLVALQAICIVFTIAQFGDAARVNVMYTMRGMWGVLLAWGVALVWGGNEAHVPRQIMMMRLVGASFLTAAVLLVVLAGN